MLTVLGLNAACSRAAHAQGYAFTKFDYPAANDTAPYGLNDGGQIVGAYDYTDSATGKTVTYGFTLSAASLTPSPDPASFASYGVGGTFTEFDAVNDAGQIVGDYVRSDGTDPGFLLSGLGHTDFLPAAQDALTPYGINKSGTVSGTAYDAGGVTQGFMRSGGGAVSFFNDPKADPSGTMGTGNNDGGTTVGYYVNNSGFFTAFVDKGGVFTDLPIPAAYSTTAFEINNRGDIVGRYRVPGTGGAFGSVQGYLLTPGGTLITLNVPGAVATYVQSVNDSRQVVGDWIDADGSLHGFFATPTPEPSQTTVLGLAVLSLGTVALKARTRR